MKRFIPLAAVALLLLTGLVYANPSDSPLVGAWVAVSYAGEEIPEGDMWFDNRDDGTGILYQMGEEFPYTWEHDQQAGTCKITADGEEMVYNVAIDGDTCTFTNPEDENDAMVTKRKAQ